MAAPASASAMVQPVARMTTAATITAAEESAFISCGSETETNCGRKVKKNITIFGLSRLTPSPMR